MTQKQNDRSKPKPNATPDPGYDRDAQGDYPAYTGRIAEAETGDAGKPAGAQGATGAPPKTPHPDDQAKSKSQS